MKLQLVLILGFLIQSQAVVSQVQTKRLSLRFENNSLKEVLQTLEEQTDFSFVYKDEQINRGNNISGDFKDKSVNEVLDDVLKQSGLTYIVKGRAIVILPRDMESVSAQQSKTVSGKVTDSSGQPLPGVSVVVKGTTTGTITDFDGKYTLANVPSDATLVFSFVGMKGQEVAVGGKTSINVKMEEDAIGIEEVVAVGYGTMKKSDLTGSVSSVKGDDLTKVSAASVSTAIAGRLPGLQVTQNTGEPGAGSVLRMRGVGSVYSGTDPLVLIDGFEGSMNQVSPNDVESLPC